MKEPITSFSGEFVWLSNFYPARVQYAGLTYPTVENAYQAAKLLDPGVRIPFTRCTPREAKRMGGRFMIRSDWEDLRLAIMEQLIRQKFADEYLRKRLCRTRGRQLIEGNNWGDRFWGMCNGVGENHLGIILMRVREDVLKIARNE